MDKTAQKSPPFPASFLIAIPLLPIVKDYTICNQLEINDEGIGHTFSNLISIALENGAIETLRKWNSDAYLWGAENSEMFIMVPLN